MPSTASTYIPHFPQLRLLLGLISNVPLKASQVPFSFLSLLREDIIGGLVSHFETVLSMGPTIIYNVPSRTGQDIPPSVVHAIVQNPNMAGVKKCMGNERIEASKGLVTWSGNDDECHDARWAFGAAGVMSVVSNLVPGLMHELIGGEQLPELQAVAADQMAVRGAEPGSGTARAGEACVSATGGWSS